MGDLIAFIRGLSVEWLIFGDFNMPVIEMEHTSIPTVVRGEVISVGGPTTLQGGEIDYGLASRSLVGSVTVQEDWEVPFRPHCALRVALRVGDFRAHVLRTTPFKRVVDSDPAPFDGNQGHKTPKVLLEPSRCDEATTSFTARVEASLYLQDRAGRGVSALIPPKATGYVWTGGPAKFWGRMAVLHKKGVKNGLSQPAQLVLQRHLQQVAQNWGDVDALTLEEALTKLHQTCAGQGSQSQEVKRIIEGQRKHHLQLHHSFNAAQYQKWLQGASEGGLRPLFRSLKKTEVQTARPYLDLAVEVRPHARRAEWAEMWAPGGLEPTLGTTAREELQQRARCQPKRGEPPAGQPASKGGLVPTLGDRPAGRSRSWRLTVHLREPHRQRPGGRGSCEGLSVLLSLHSPTRLAVSAAATQSLEKEK